jgi:pilus assembly protein CpaC
MKMENKNTTRRRTLRGVFLAAGAGLIALGIFITPSASLAQAVAAAAPTTMPANATKLVAEGVGADGKIHLAVNKTVQIVTTQPYKTVSIGSSDIADVNPVGANTLIVTAKKMGSTQLIIIDDGGHSQVADIIVGLDVEALQTELNTAFPAAHIQVAAMNGAISLRGQVPDLKTAEQAANMAGTYGTRVLNMLEVAGGQQVLLQVRFAEVNRKATNQLGVNFGFTDGVTTFGSNIGQLSPLGLAGAGALAPGSPTGSVTLFGGGQIGNTAINYFVAALRQNNLLRILAEPNLTAISGQEASFLAGGEFPVPVPQSGSGGGSTITIEYKEFGVRLNFVPVVLGDGRIRLKLTPEVSDLDFSSPLIIQGSRIPIVNKRTVTTTVEMAEGQTFAVAGLLQHSVNATKNVTPLLGDIPVLGALFRSVQYDRQETELVVLVTPHLVEPMMPNQVPPLPGENYKHPSELDFYLNGDLGGETPAGRGNSPTPAGGTGGTGTAAAPSAPPRYRGSYGYTPPPRSTTSGSNE